MTLHSQDGPVDEANTMGRIDARVRAKLFGSEDSSVPRTLELRVGDRIGRHIVLEYLGAGGMGHVYAAHDPTLDRKVAIKLVSPRAWGDSQEARTRLLREAQALARLTHPNVVAVHDAGMECEQVWIAMELIDGQTLGDWVQERPRRWPEVLRVLTDAAAGVTAAHAVGLVHRDLKPGNVMISRDGRVRVMDFGLAHATTSVDIGPTVPVNSSPLTTDVEVTDGADSDPQTVFPALGRRVTLTGKVLGTPGYIAPEHWERGVSDAAADQFGWSVMAWELLYGELPFAGATATTSTRRPSPPKGRRVPRWLNRIIERGLSLDPARRWPTMAALLAALGRSRARARVWLAAALGFAVAVVAVGAEGLRRLDVAHRVEACRSRGAAVEATWNDSVRQEVRAAFVATGAGYAEDSASKVIPWVNEQAVLWGRARTEACLNTEVQGVWDRELYERANWCLDERRIELESLLSLFVEADAQTVRMAVSAASHLEPPADCLDEDDMRRRSVPPDSEEFQAVFAELSRAQGIGLAGDYQGALAIATKVRERAEGVTDLRPLWLRARADEGDFLNKTGDYAAAERVSTEAYFEAARTGAWDIAARAALGLIYVVGIKQARHTDGEAWALHAQVALAHTSDRGSLWEVRRLNNLALVRGASGAHAEARVLNERALALTEEALGPGHPSVAHSLNNLANLHKSAGAYAEALDLHKRVLAIREQTLGTEHPDVSMSLNNTALAYKAMGELSMAQVFLTRALAIRERALGSDHTDVAASLANLASVHSASGQHSIARPLYERALAIQERALGADHPDVAKTLANLAVLAQTTGDSARARVLHERGLAIRERTLGPEHPDVGVSLLNLAVVRRALGDHAEARAINERALAIMEKAVGPNHPHVAAILINLGIVLEDLKEDRSARLAYERALAIREKMHGPNHPGVAASLVNLAGTYMAARKPRAALPLLERAVGIFEAHPGVQEGELAARFNLARVLLKTRSDRGRAVMEARRAREAYRETGEGGPAALAEVERWLAAHAPQK